MVTESEILQRFIRGGTLGKGIFAKEIPVGLSNIRNRIKKGDEPGIPPRRLENMYIGPISKKIDAVFVKDEKLKDEYQRLLGDFDLSSEPLPSGKLDEKKIFLKKIKGRRVWLLEVKKKLNWGALGQIIAYEKQFERDNPKIIIDGKGIICEHSDEIIEESCKDLNVEVFKV